MQEGGQAAFLLNSPLRDVLVLDSQLLRNSELLAILIDSDNANDVCTACKLLTGGITSIPVDCRIAMQCLQDVAQKIEHFHICRASLFDSDLDSVGGRVRQHRHGHRSHVSALYRC